MTKSSDLVKHGEPKLTKNERKLIRDAVEYLENPSLLMEIADKIGKPLEFLLKGIEKCTPELVEKAALAALESAVNVALYTIRESGDGAGKQVGSDITEIGLSTDWWHTVAVGVTGAIGGFFGPIGLPVELPITTTIMLRSIAAIAQDFGEKLDDPEVRFQCLAVFAFGGPSQAEDAKECFYLTARFGLDPAIRKAVTMVQRGAAPVLTEVLTQIAARFDIVVTEKIVAQSLPFISAACAATINVAFIDHFNRVARFHFAIRNLERKYGVKEIQEVYQKVTHEVKQTPAPRLGRSTKISRGTQRVTEN
jgi:hypothetical protein